MKSYLSLLAALICGCFTFAQTNHALEVESYQLENGLTVLLNPDPTASRVFGAVMVKAGAKHESPEATGMAHYLEHLLFKGTQTLGTMDYEAERPHLDSINRLYEQLAQTEDPTLQTQLQQQINEQAKAASEYGLPNEFDRLLRSIGGTGINAFTSYEMTFYHNSFPAHEIERWLDLYATRFDDPVFRSFQSELEVVYEEKNRAMDNIQRKFVEEITSQLYPNLPYGQWSVLGTVEHLKKPSLIRMYEFFEKNYVPGNMALILSGNFDAEGVKPMIETRFGAWEARPVPELDLPELQPIEGKVVEKVRITPIKVGTLSWQTVPMGHPDRLAMDLCEYLLFNEAETGMLNQLQLNGDVMYAFGFGDRYLDAGGFNLILVPKPIVQSLGGVKKKVLNIIDEVKAGNIPETLFLAAKNALSADFQRSLEDLDARGRTIGWAFAQGMTWEEYLSYPDRIEEVSMEEVAAVAQRYLGENRVEIISRTGFGKPPKLDKPPFEPVTTDQNGSSAYAAQFEAMQSQPFAPRFLDFEADVQRATLPGGHELWVNENPLNDVFTLSIRWQKGQLTDPALPLAANVLEYSGTDEMDLEELKQTFASLGCSYSVSAGNNTFTAYLSGQEENLEQALELLGKWLKAPVPQPKVMDLLHDQISTERKLEEESPSDMGRTLVNYALYGERSPYLTRPSLDYIKQASVEEQISKVKALTEQYQAEITFEGNTAVADLETLLLDKLPLSEDGQAEPFQLIPEQQPSSPRIMVIDDKKAVQSHVYFFIPGVEMTQADYPQVQAFNEYFGGGFSGLVLQEIREYRSLAYSAGASYNQPALAGESGRMIGYIGCQADKTLNAIEVMHGLVTDMPLKPERMDDLRSSLQMKVVTAYPDFRAVIDRIRTYQRQGFDTDPNEAAYEAYADMTMEDIQAFYQKAIQGQPYVITIYGDTSRFDMEQLKELGEVEVLELDEVRR